MTGEKYQSFFIESVIILKKGGMNSMHREKFESILNELELPFHRDLFESSMDILETDIKTKFSNFATNIRELSRLVLEYLAPNDEVKKCPWYVEFENNYGEVVITRIQRMLYAVKGGLSDEFIVNKLEIDATSYVKKFNKVIQTLNKYTHINSEVYYRGEEAGLSMVEETLEAFNNFLKIIKITRNEIINALENELDSLISDALTEDVIQEIDILSTHHWIDTHYIDNISINELNSSYIEIFVQGYVDVEQQYGSDRDVSRGDGIRREDSFPFSIQLVQSVENPLAISIEINDIEVNTDSFYE